jgi:hypothetical protein
MVGRVRNSYLQMKIPVKVHSLWMSLFHYFILAFQFGLLLILIYQYDLESRALLHLGILTFFGFSVHYFLPFRYRLPFFLLLSLATIEVTFGFQLEKWSLAGLLQGTWLIGIGLGLIGICYLPISFRFRIVLLLVIGGVLCVLRIGLIGAPWSGAIWPILGSMFMFRLIVYLYELRHETTPPSVVETLSYFFMLPNVCFPLFPVVDFRTFRRTYYDHTDRYRIYQVGIHWMFRGIVHLILYRFVYQHLVIDASDVSNLDDLLQFLIWPFLLYLRVSGQFHLIVGLLHIFGFNLPETHHLYFISPNFAAFWRRINIYWKDFMMTIFYYPIYFKVRRWGNTAALVVATLFVFFATWLLHSYQLFWIRGSFLFAWHDVLFWTMLGLLTLGNALYESKHGRHRTIGDSSLSWPAAVATALRTVGVFFTICVLWSLWSTPSVGRWFFTLGAAQHGTLSPLRLISWIFIMILAVGLPALIIARGYVGKSYTLTKSRTMVTALSVLLIVMAIPSVYYPFGLIVRETITSLQHSELNQSDFAILEGGYYEKLLDVEQFNPELWEIYRTRPKDWTTLLQNTEVAQMTGRLPRYELVPSRAARHDGVVVRTNSLGLRDREYTRVRPPDTLRIAMVGSSFVMGVGVENDETFEAVLEEHLNAVAKGTAYARYELLNFGVGGYSPLDHLFVVENKVFDLNPNWVFYIEHADATRPLLNRMVDTLVLRLPHPYDALRDIVRKAGIDESSIGEDTDRVILKQKLKPYALDILSWIYHRIVDACRIRGIPAVWIYLPRPERQEVVPELEMQLAKEAGFTIIDLSGVYGTHEPHSLWIARWDHHPNALGHRLIADRLYEVLREKEEVFGFGLSNAVN